jgi:hypothetical protein
MPDEARDGRPEDDPPPEIDRQIRALTEIVGMLAAKVMHPGDTGAGRSPDQPNDTWLAAPWAWAGPTMQDGVQATDNEVVVERFIAFYNQTYVGLEGRKAKPIPPCWRQHPGLAMEITTLAYTWLSANLGATADVRDAQTWHHQWRPAFTDRLASDWVSSDCLDGLHTNTVRSPGTRRNRS